MGYLDQLLAGIDNTKRVVGRNVSDMVSDPRLYAEKIVGALRNQNAGVAPVAAGGELTNRPLTMEERVENTAGQLDFGGGLGKIVWHGSPHKFDKFNMSKIGTGEGAQAYGHGLYMAESPDVAKTYVGGNTGYVKEPLISGKAVDQLPKELLHKWEMDTGGSSYSLFDQLRLSNDPAKTIAFYKKEGGTLGKVAEEIEKMGVSLKDAGSLYKTDIPDEAVARFLDWDKPLSQQAPEVQDAIKRISPTNRSGQSIVELDPNGSELVSLLAKDSNDALLSAGIPGIRYLDGGSRNTGTGTSNYVLFDDQLPRILSRNGEVTGLHPWKLGEFDATINALRNK